MSDFSFVLACLTAYLSTLSLCTIFSSTFFFLSWARIVFRPIFLLNLESFFFLSRSFDFKSGEPVCVDPSERRHLRPFGERLLHA